MANWKNTILEWDEMSQVEETHWMAEVCEAYLSGVEFDIVAVRYDLSEMELFSRLIQNQITLRDEDVRVQRKRRRRGERQLGAEGAPVTLHY